jgi:hypothetical protein
LEKEGVIVYPNPVSDVLTVVNSSDGTCAIRMANDQSTVVFGKQDAGQETKIDVSTFKNGIYILETTVGGKKKSQKIIVKH